ncbi:hypothetical protein CSHISOI_00248 [Colletotrichum shisoi]|uniref:Uncharacterized protein n=1 Tax=Colletotrichum shisoi TaxID=2078593 RepID=A0A5Q4CAM6_9PEZI|nr:hypothetical protein CSHISOI_00248 [Colletotrichum shisoi]
MIARRTFAIVRENQKNINRRGDVLFIWPYRLQLLAYCATNQEAWAWLCCWI